MRTFLYSVVPLGLVASLACGSDAVVSNPVAPTSPPVAVATTLRLTGNTALGAIGQTSQLTLTANYTDGTTRDVTGDAAWSSNRPAVATVANGVVTIVGFGAATITAAYQGRGAQVEVSALVSGTFIFKGRVRQPGAGSVAGARVFEQISNAETIADNSGDFQFVGLPAIRLRIDLAGYETFQNAVTPAANGQRTVFVDAPLQKTVRISAGQSTGRISIAPNDVSYRVGDDLCNPCKLIRVTAGGAASLVVRLTSEGAAAGALNLWADGERYSSSGSTIAATVPAAAGDTVIYVGRTQPEGQGAAQYAYFTVSVD